MDLKYLIKLEKVNINKNTVILEKEWLFFCLFDLEQKNALKRQVVFAFLHTAIGIVVL